MNEEPLKLIPEAWRDKAFEKLGLEGRPLSAQDHRRPQSALPFHLQPPDVALRW
jgi:hypothetical protein